MGQNSFMKKVMIELSLLVLLIISPEVRTFL